MSGHRGVQLKPVLSSLTFTFFVFCAAPIFFPLQPRFELGEKAWIEPFKHGFLKIILKLLVEKIRGNYVLMANLGIITFSEPNFP